MRRFLMSGWLAAFAIFCAGAQAQNAASELPVAEWLKGSEMSLEDFRGQVTALIFYDDSET